MKICMVSTALYSGGILSCFRPVIDLYIDEGHTIDIYVYSGYNVEFYNQYKDKVNFEYLKPPKLLEKCEIAIKTGFVWQFIKEKINRKVVFSKTEQNYNINIVNAMEEIEQEYDVAIAMHEFFPLYYVTQKVKAKKKICWEHPSFDKFTINDDVESKFFEKMSVIVCVSNECKRILDKKYPNLCNRIIVLRNIIEVLKIREKSMSQISMLFDKTKLNICTVCRIDNASKRLDRVVYVAKRLKEEQVRFRWIIVGDGADRSFIEKLVKKFNLYNEVIFVGNQDNPYPYMLKSDVFVLSSQYEGLPISVYEALSLNRYVIATDCIDWDYELKKHIRVVSNNEDMVVNEMADAIINYQKNKYNYRVSEKIFDFDNTKRELIALLSM